MIFAGISCLVCVGFPLAGAVYFLKRRDGTFVTFLTGAACFYIAQPLLRIPLLGLVQNEFPGFALLPYQNRVVYYLFMALTAGIFEESARWLGLRVVRRGRTSWMEGMAYGLGHGGCEAAWMFVTQVIPLVQAGNTGWNLAIGAWERVFAILVQIGLSYVVLYGIKEKKWRYLLLAVFLHGAVDFFIILGNVWVIEGLLAAEGTAALVLVLKKRKCWK